MDTESNSTSFANLQGFFPPYTAQLTGGKYKSDPFMAGFATAATNSQISPLNAKNWPSVIFVWLADPDGGVVDWFLTKLPPWLDGGSHWAGFSWTNAALPAYTLLTVPLVWTGYPFVAVAVLAGLRTIPAELHESARVDGAGPWQLFWRVT